MTPQDAHRAQERHYLTIATILFCAALTILCSWALVESVCAKLDTERMQRQIDERLFLRQGRIRYEYDKREDRNP